MSTTLQAEPKRKTRPMEEALGREQRAFQRQRTQLLRRYAGQYVAFYRGRLVGHEANDENLARRMFERFGDAAFYIARVEENPSVCELPSPETVG
jgi:hypothetical protein